MRITFMVGNGFDKCVGLKTGYDDFYKSLPDETIWDKERIIVYRD